MVCDVSLPKGCIGGFVTKTNGQACFDVSLTKTDSSYKSNFEDVYVGSFESKEEIKKYVSKQINSFEDFLSNYQALSSKTGETKDIDYKTEFKDFLASKGCLTESELQALNKAGYDSVDEMKKEARLLMAKTLIDMAKKNQYAGNISEDIDYILNNSSTECIASYCTEAKKGDSEAKTALKNLIKSLPEDDLESKNKKSSLLKFFDGAAPEEGFNNNTINFVEKYNQKQIMKYL